MNDLLAVAVPFVAFVVLLFAWISQNRKATPVRTAKAVRPVPTVVAVEADRSERGGVQVPA